MRKLIAVALTLVLLLLCSCTNTGTTPQPTTPTEPETAGYMIIEEIDHCVVEPDDELHMSEEDKAHYKMLMEGMLDRESKIKLSDSKEQNEYYLDLLKQSPYFFFIDDYNLSDNSVNFTYAYSEEQQNKMLSFIDDKFLKIVNSNASENDNTLDKILNVYAAVAREMTYDHSRTKDMELESPLFQYPDDEIYLALKNSSSVCYGFAYTLRFALLQLDIDCFCVYGPCRDQGEAHMWNIFKYNDKFYTCDVAWDRSEEDYAQLNHFGKTTKEREVDSLKIKDYSSTFFDEYGEIECTDETFKMFRSIDRYSIVSTHTYFLSDFQGNEYIFDTETLEMKK